MKRTAKTLAIAAAGLALGLAALGNWSAPATHAQTPGLASAPIAPLTGAWAVDPAHTNVNFAIRHFGISTVRGRFDDIAGAISADAAHPENSSVQFTMQAASVDTNVKMRDDDLRSANYFDVAKYPTLTFQSTKVRKGKRGSYVADGDLTIHGVTKAISLPFRVSGPIRDAFGGSRIGLETGIRLNRTDFGVGGTDKLANGAMDIGTDVDVTISLEAIPAKPATP
ncbi:MAG TPA: YceI family protein [Armatimonadota bacterium]|jgi:polyisoprenoid-binding protein YceI